MRCVADGEIFAAAGDESLQRDFFDAELHRIDSGQFALEDKLGEMVPLIRDFLGRNLK